MNDLALSSIPQVTERIARRGYPIKHITSAMRADCAIVTFTDGSQANVSEANRSALELQPELWEGGKQA